MVLFIIPRLKAGFVKTFQSKFVFLSIFMLLSLVISQTGCSSPEPTLTQVVAKTLPPTWTDEPTLEVISTPTKTPTLTPSDTPEPMHNWWAMSFEPSLDLRVKFAKETRDGGILLWTQVRDRDGQVIQDQIINLQKNGFPAWEKVISPPNTRVQLIQEKEDGSLLLFGFQQNNDFQYPFYIHLSELGEVLDSGVYQRISAETDRNYMHISAISTTVQFGKLNVKGELPGTHYISAYHNHSDGGMTVMGPIHGPITSDGATFSYLRGLWAVRLDVENQIIWQRFFQTSPTGPFFHGVVLPDGSVLATSEYPGYSSILKLDPEGYTTYWRYYSPLVAIQSLSGTSDGSSIIASSKILVKLDPLGEIVWSKELAIDDDQTWIQYAFEADNGDLVLFLDSRSLGLIVSRLNMDQPFEECPPIQFAAKTLFEHFPYLPYNISGSVRVTPSAYDLDEWTKINDLNTTTIGVNEICRYRD